MIRFSGTNFYLPMAVSPVYEKNIKQLMTSPEVLRIFDFDQVKVVQTKAGKNRTDQALAQIAANSIINLHGLNLEDVYRHVPQSDLTAGACSPVVHQLTQQLDRVHTAIRRFLSPAFDGPVFPDPDPPEDVTQALIKEAILKPDTADLLEIARHTPDQILDALQDVSILKELLTNPDHLDKVMADLTKHTPGLMFRMLLENPHLVMEEDGQSLCLSKPGYIEHGLPGLTSPLSGPKKNRF